MKHKNKKTIFRILFAITIILVFLFLIWFYRNITHFAILSVLSSCEPDYFAEKYRDEYYSEGQFAVSYNETIEDAEIFIFVYEDAPKSILKHEECHLRQFRWHYLGNCNNRWLLLLNEHECYSVQCFWELFE